MVKSLFVVIVACALVGCSLSPEGSSAPTLSSNTRLEESATITSNLVELSYAPVTVSAKVEAIRGSDKERLDSVCLDWMKELSVPFELERSYKSDDFAGFLPPNEVSLGDLWAIPEGAVTPFLDQFHPSVTDQVSDRDGRGSYAILRAVSESHFEVLIRSHSQFKFPDGFTLTPAQFEGRLLVDREAGSVEFFEFSVPVDHMRNVNYESLDGPGKVGMLFIPLMRLRSSSPELLHRVWSEEIDLTVARKRLGQKFFPLEKIAWVEPGEVLRRAKESEKPIFFVLIEGVLTDQSC